jgi:hypothetical protein
MKKIIILPILLAFVAAFFGQQITPKQDWTETGYYKKSKKQKTTHGYCWAAAQHYLQAAS